MPGFGSGSDTLPPNVSTPCKTCLWNSQFYSNPKIDKTLGKLKLSPNDSHFSVVLIPVLPAGIFDKTDHTPKTGNNSRHIIPLISMKE